MHQDTLPWLVVEAAKNIEKNSKVTCGCSQLGLESNVYSKPPHQKNMTRAKQQSISVGWHPVRWYSCFLFVKPEFFLRQISFLQIPSLLKLYMYQLSSMKHGVFRFNGFSDLQPTWCGTSGRSVATNLRFKSTGYLMVINGDCLWLLVINGWLMVINGDCWWLLVINGWLMVINGD